MSIESIRWQKEITEMIKEFGEKMTFSRGGSNMGSMIGAFGKISMRNIVPNDASPIQSQQKVISIPVTARYQPETMDVVTDSHKNIYQIVQVDTSRYQDTDLCYILTIT